MRWRALIHATDKPITGELKAGATQSAKDDAEENLLAVPLSTVPAAVPKFWLTTLRNHVGLSDLITDRDADALKYITELRIEYLPSSKPKPRFKLIFKFSPNKYDCAIGMEIKWKNEKDLTKEFEIMKQWNRSEFYQI